jgi:hypothetical protein
VRWIVAMPTSRAAAIWLSLQTAGLAIIAMQKIEEIFAALVQKVIELVSEKQTTRPGWRPGRVSASGNTPRAGGIGSKWVNREARSRRRHL